jgi:type II secretory pathway pseudopilin PulG
MLLEVLIGLAIAALASAAVMQTLTNGVLSSARAQRETQAGTIAGNALATAVAIGGRRLTERRELSGGFLREVTIAARPDLVGPNVSADLVPYQVDVVVTWSDGRVLRRLVLSTLRLGDTPGLTQ